MTMGEDLPREQARCRELLRQYHECASLYGGRVNVSFAVASIEVKLRAADEAVVSGDLVAMLRAYAALKDCE